MTAGSANHPSSVATLAEIDQTLSSVAIVTSDCARNGKTLFSKLMADLLTLRRGDAPQIFDTDFPAGGLAAHFENTSQIVDLNRTTDQVKIFDGMLNSKGEAYIIDLVARHHSKFFDIYRDTGFEQGAREAALDVTIFFVIDRELSSIQAARDIHKSLRDTRFVVVRNAAVGDALEQPEAAKLYAEMRVDREIILPDLSPVALGMLEHVDFHFDIFVADGYSQFPFELKAELWSFLETLYEQREQVDRGAAQPL